jgi:hypothetical protein
MELKNNNSTPPPTPAVSGAASGNAKVWPHCHLPPLYSALEFFELYETPEVC